MSQTKSKRRSRTHSRKRSLPATSNNLKNEIASRFFEVLITIKLFHWKTLSYASHKATDELSTSLHERMDQMMEILLGKSRSRMNFEKNFVPVHDFNSQEELRDFIDGFKTEMESLTGKVNAKEDTDILTVRDEVLADLNKFLYLLTLK
jgi:hypothetical protein